jgi:hypothetical protein
MDPLVLISISLLLHRHLHGVPSRRDTVYIDTYTESPHGGTPSTSTPTRSPLAAGYHLHRHLHGVPSWRGTVYIDNYMESPEAGRCPHRCLRVASHHGEAARTCNVCTGQALHGHHRVYSNIYTNIIIDVHIIHALTRRGNSPPNCLLPMKQTTTCFAKREAKSSHQVRHRQGGHHQAWHRQGEGRPHLHHRTSTSRRHTAMHRRSERCTAPPFRPSPTSPPPSSWRK